MGTCSSKIKLSLPFNYEMTIDVNNDVFAIELNAINEHFSKYNKSDQKRISMLNTLLVSSQASKILGINKKLIG
jgi:hypothetical protein